MASFSLLYLSASDERLIGARLVEFVERGGVELEVDCSEEAFKLVG